MEPCLLKDFLASSWGRQYRHIRGWPGKFAQLLPWDRLNDLLRRHRLDFPRLRLMRDGQSLSTSSYLWHLTGVRRKVPVPRLLPVELTRHLRQGATLVLDAVDELHEPLEELAEGLELFFHERVQINAYAGWQTSRGFDLHWDDHDVFVLQVTGRKRWSVYGMTRPYPLAQERAARPADGPLWEETLEDGDLLYIPRGWWHVAMPLAEPTLHLTVGVHTRTGIDLLRWLTERMRASEVFRQDLPRFSSGAERAAHLERLRREFLAEWSADLLERYFEDSDAMASARARLSLPWSAMPEVLPPTNDTLLRLTAPRPLNFRIEGGVIEFACQQKRWRFAESAEPILRRLAEGRVCSISELCEAASGRLDERTVRAFLSELILHGLIAIVKH
ncbi:MAG TPA: cupin domain-containing protein [Pyrinomonadaceae bacterium]|nr:cupin domain-containing protein [Pyrinomonadaceae bacterium]